MINYWRFPIRQLYCNHVKSWLHMCQMLQAEIKFTQLTQLFKFFVVTNKDGCGPSQPLQVLTSQNIRNSSYSAVMSRSLSRVR